MPEPNRGSTSWRIAAPVVLALCGILLVTSAKASEGDDLRGSDVLELSDLIRNQERHAREMAGQVEDLTAEVDALAAELGTTENHDVQAEIDALSAAAGIAAVEGPGLTITLDDAPVPGNGQLLPEGLHIEDYIVHQEDLEGVINALWSGGAEAMTVMDQRIIATSTIRCVGPVLLLEGQQYSPPYRISAIGDTERMQQALTDSDAVREYRNWVDYLGLGYQVETEETITMSGYEGSIGRGSTS